MPERPSQLALLALRYAAGELGPAEATAFEERLAVDQDAREALGEAIRLSAAALDRPAPAPDPLVREVVRDSLQPTLLSRLFPRRRYRGHPFAWVGLGAAATIAVVGMGVWLGEPPPRETFGPPQTAEGPPPPASAPPVLPAVHRVAEPPIPELAPLPRPVEDRLARTEPVEPPTSERTFAVEPAETTGRPSEPKASVNPDADPR